MTYRDDLGAAVSRADALQQEIDALEQQAKADKDRIRSLTGQLREARSRIASLEQQLPAGQRPPSSMRTPLLGAGVVVFICSVAGAFMARTRPPPAPAMPPEIPVVWEAPAPLPPPPAPDPPATLSVSSSPPGARVVIDGSPVGETPMALSVAPGEHQVVVTLGDRVQGQHLDIIDFMSLEVDFAQVSTYEIQTALSKTVGRCALGWSGQVIVKFTVEATGRVSDAAIVGDHADTASGRCLVKLVRGTRFPAARNATSVLFPVVFP